MKFIVSSASLTKQLQLISGVLNNNNTLPSAMPPRKRPAAGSPGPIGLGGSAADAPSDDAIVIALAVLQSAYSRNWHEVENAAEPSGVRFRTGLHTVIVFLETIRSQRREAHEAREASAHGRP